MKRLGLVAGLGLAVVMWVNAAPAGACSPPEEHVDPCYDKQLVAVEGEFLSSEGEPADLGPDLVVMMEGSRVVGVIVDGIELRRVR